MSRRLLQKNVNEGTARKKVIRDDRCARYIQNQDLIFVSRVEEYVFAFTAFAVFVSDPFATIFRCTGLLFFEDFLFTGKPCFQKNIDGTAVGFNLFLRPVSDVR